MPWNPCEPHPQVRQVHKETPVIEQTIDIPTKDGKTTTFIVHP